MILLQGPHPNYQTTTVLPDPQLDDSRAAKVSVNFQRSINGTRYTTVRKATSSTFNYTFRNLTTAKAAELEQFYLSYSASTIRLTDKDGAAWLVKFVNDPWQFSEPKSQYQDITIQFEGTPL